jgi:hypothetical protein
MVDPVVSKVITTPASAGTDQSAASPVKVGESKFDKVRAGLQQSQATNINLPPEVKQVSPEQKQVLQADLNNRLKTTSSQQIFSSEMTNATNSFQQLALRVNALPKTSALDPLRQRLASIDSQFQATGRLVNSVKGTESPAELMKIQMQMYQLSENLELTSKVVDQITSGVKSILQTQI